MIFRSLSFIQNSFILLKTEGTHKIALSHQEKIPPFNSVGKRHDDSAKINRCKAKNRKKHLEHKKRGRK